MSSFYWGWLAVNAGNYQNNKVNSQRELLWQRRWYHFHVNAGRMMHRRLIKQYGWFLILAIPKTEKLFSEMRKIRNYSSSRALSIYYNIILPYLCWHRRRVYGEINLFRKIYRLGSGGEHESRWISWRAWTKISGLFLYQIQNKTRLLNVLDLILAWMPFSPKKDDCCTFCSLNSRNDVVLSELGDQTSRACTL